MKKRKLRKSNRFRIVFLTILFLLFYTTAILSAINMLQKEQGKNINYQEDKIIDYKVNLKENDFYEENSLGSDMAYIASLIKSIDINFNYRFRIEEKTDLDFHYDVTANLMIQDDNGNHTYFKKKYNLKEGKEEAIKGKKNYEVSETIPIDYGYYNDLANRFRTQYGVATKSYLEVSLNVKKETPKSFVDYNLNNEQNLKILIPLSEKAIDITINQENEKVDNTIVQKPKRVFHKDAFYISYIFLFLSVCCFLILVQNYMKPSPSKYDTFIKKTLKEYDRLIVESNNMPDVSKLSTIVIDKFSELLDVHDNLKLPIMYYEKKTPKESYFYIKHNEDLYLFTIKDE